MAPSHVAPNFTAACRAVDHDVRISIVESLELEVGRESYHELSESPLGSSDKISTAVESVDEHGSSLCSMEVEDDVGPFVEVGGAAKDVGKVAVLTTQVVGGDGSSSHHSGALGQCVTDLSPSGWMASKKTSGHNSSGQQHIL